MLKDGTDSFFTPFSRGFEQRFRVWTEDHNSWPAIDVLTPPEFELVIVDYGVTYVISYHSLPEHVQVLLVLKLGRMAANKGNLWQITEQLLKPVHLGQHVDAIDAAA